MRQNDYLMSLSSIIGRQDTFQFLHEELTNALKMYWSTASAIVQGSNISLHEPSLEYYSIENNLFAILFHYSYYKADIPVNRRILYTAVNQCLKGMIAGCDNILDNEYQKARYANLPEQRTQFRSILDILVSDRVLFSLFINASANEIIPHSSVLTACFETLYSLTQSGIQEASKKKSIGQFLKPEQILNMIHHYKGGMLFQNPWAVPSVIEDQDQVDSTRIKEALYLIGIGYQILDDMVNFLSDIRTKHHNYIVSLIYFGNNSKERDLLETIMASRDKKNDGINLLINFSDAMQIASSNTLAYLKKGILSLLKEEDKSLTDSLVAFVIEQAGVDGFVAQYLN